MTNKLIFNFNFNKFQAAETKRGFLLISVFDEKDKIPIKIEETDIRGFENYQLNVNVSK